MSGATMTQANHAFWLTPLRVVQFIGLALGVYLIGYGFERFYYEALGTWLLSPMIYAKICPGPMDVWLFRAFNGSPLLCFLACGVPAAMLMLAVGSAFYSIRRNSLKLAWGCLFLVLTVFSVFHCLQPMGFSFSNAQGP